MMTAVEMMETFEGFVTHDHFNDRECDKFSVFCSAIKEYFEQNPAVAENIENRVAEESVRKTVSRIISWRGPTTFAELENHRDCRDYSSQEIATVLEEFVEEGRMRKETKEGETYYFYPMPKRKIRFTFT